MEKSLNLGHLAEEFAKLLVDEPVSLVPEDTIELDDGERRDVTILFLDIVGYTKLAETLDPEQLKFVMANTLQVFTNQIKRCGGIVEKYIGDAIMAVFGRNQAAEDDDRRAVMAGLGILERLEDVNSILAQKGLTISARIGINRGLIVTGQLGEQETITGEAVNVAQRLEANAQPNTILIADTVYQRCRGSIACEALPPLQVKNKTAPITAWRVLAVKSVASDTAQQPLEQLIGRESELHCLQNARSQAGQRQLTLARVAGDAGIGKTAMLQTFLRTAQPLWVTADSFGMAPFQAVGDLLRAFVRQSGLTLTAWIAELRDADIRSALTEYALYLRDLTGEPLAPEERKQLQQMEPKARQAETLLALKRWLGLAAELHAAQHEAPLTVVCDNWQWIPVASRDALTRVLTMLAPDTPLLWVVSGRDLRDLPEADGVVTHDLPLAPLTLEAVEQLVAASYPAHAIAPSALRRIFAKTGGNPLYIRELFTLFAHDGEGLATIALDDRLPATITSLVLSRLDRLPRTQKFAVQIAAVAGRASSLTLMQHLFAKTQCAEEAQAICRELSAAGWMTASGEDLRIAQPMVADVAYGTILYANRRKLHAAVAEWCQESTRGADESWCAYLAEQWERAEEYPAALPFYLRAGEAAKQQYAYRDAARFFERARHCGVKQEDARLTETLLSIAVRRTELYEALGQSDEWQQAIAEGLEYAEPASATAARLQLRQIEWEYRFGDRAVATTTLAALADGALVRQFPDVRLWALIQQCNGAYERGEEVGPFIAEVQAARDTITDAKLRYVVDNAIFNYYKNTDQLGQAEAYFSRVLAASAHNPYNQHLTDLFFCSFMWDRGAAFDRIAERALAAAHYFDEIGWLRGVAWGYFYGCAALWRMGETARAMQQLRYAIALMTRAGDTYMLTRLQLVAAGVAASQQQQDVFSLHAAAVLQAVADTPADQPAMRTSLALFVGQYADDAPQVAAAAQTLRELGRTGLSRVEYNEYDVTCAMLAIREERFADAQGLLTQVVPHLRAEGKLWLLGLALRGAGLVATQAGDLAAAQTAFAESVVIHQQIAAHLDAQRTYQSWWGALLRSGLTHSPVAEAVRRHVTRIAVVRSTGLPLEERGA